MAARLLSLPREVIEHEVLARLSPVALRMAEMACGEIQSITRDEEEERRPLLTSLCTERGDLDTLRWLRGIGARWNEETFAAVASGDYYTSAFKEIFRYLNEEGCPCDNSVVTAAIKNDNGGLLCRLMDHGFDYGGAEKLLAAELGSVECLTLLLEVDEDMMSWNRRVLLSAIKGGHLDLIEYFGEIYSLMNVEDVPTGAECLEAARRGHLDILKWLRQDHFPWDRERCYREATAQEVKDWIKQQA